jgi:type II secretory pathway pseudopilin PulG
MKLPDIGIKLPDIPRHVTIAAVVLAVSGVLFGTLLPTLGASLDQAIVQNKKLQSDIAQAGKVGNQARADYKFATENREKFEAVLQSDRLIPHTNRDAAQKLQTTAVQDGVTALTWQFGAVAALSAASVTSQVKQSGYRVDVQSIGLHIGAPLDGQIYRFIADLDRGFPGSVVLASVSLARPEKLTNDAINGIGRVGTPGLVTGEISLLWRTAQANDSEKKAP